MSRTRTYYPTVNQALYDCKDTFDEFLNKCFEKTGMTDPEKSALNTLHAALVTASETIPRYKEAR